VVTGPAVIFVRPSYGCAFTVEEMEAMIASDKLDEPYRQQADRLNEPLRDTGICVSKVGSDAARFRFDWYGEPRILDLTEQTNWRGVVLFCPGAMPLASDDPSSDSLVLEATVACMHEQAR